MMEYKPAYFVLKALPPVACVTLPDKTFNSLFTPGLSFFNFETSENNHKNLDILNKKQKNLNHEKSNRSEVQGSPFPVESIA